MPKRNRHKERQRHGGELVTTAEPPRQVLAEVNDNDRIMLGRLTLWALRYVNHVYEHGGHPGKPLPKRVSESIHWSVGSLRPGDEARFSASSRQRTDVAFPGLVRPTSDEWQEYDRQRDQGILLDVTMERYADPDDWRSQADHLSLAIDADGAIARGSYSWIGPSEDDRTVPNAMFASLDEVHQATVSARAALILGRFRSLVLDPNSGLHMHGTWNHQLGVTPPEALHDIPELPSVS